MTLRHEEAALRVARAWRRLLLRRDALEQVGWDLWRDSYARRRAAYLWDMDDDPIDLAYSRLAARVGASSWERIDEIQLAAWDCD